MPMRRTVALRCLVLVILGPCSPQDRLRPRAWSTSRPTTPSTNTGSRCGTASSSSRRLCPQGRRPDLSDPAAADALLASGPTGSIIPSRSSARPRCSAGRATSSPIRTSAGSYLSEGDSSTSGPRSPASGPKDIDESTDTLRHHRLAGQERPGQQRQGRHLGHLLSRLLRGRRPINAHPALKAVSPQAPLIDWFLGDDVHHNGAFFLQQEFNFDAVFGLPAPEPTTKSQPARSTTGPPTPTSSS